MERKSDGAFCGHLRELLARFDRLADAPLDENGQLNK